MTAPEVRPTPPDTGRQIVVLGGGDSAERAVSLASSAAVAAALRERGHDVLERDPAVSDLSDLDPRQTRIVFPMLHGTGAEDGSLQRQLNRLRLPFTGSDVAASELTFDKVRCQAFLRQSGLPVPDSVVFRSDEPLARRLPELRRLGSPLVVKPSRQGSSVGVTVVSEESGLAAAVREAAAWGREILVEAWVPGRELTVPVIDGTVFPAVEIVPQRPWYDYLAKYHDDRTGYRVGPEGLPAAVDELAESACRLCDVRGIARVDLRLPPDGPPRILEINTIPGMTSHSLVPQSARHRGLSLGELCENVIAFRLRAEDGPWHSAA